MFCTSLCFCGRWYLYVFGCPLRRRQTRKCHHDCIIIAQLQGATGGSTAKKGTEGISNRNPSDVGPMSRDTKSSQEPLATDVTRRNRATFYWTAVERWGLTFELLSESPWLMHHPISIRGTKHSRLSPALSVPVQLSPYFSLFRAPSVVIETPTEEQSVW